ncbi:hypothetical protein ACF09J_06955 [Streptomyces sp. NPDC014889]|uniref:hypothetical protein n=1 Tax=Streptomyces sp. NPDC014889 TaxID=3364928 RepID=UPI003702CB14
MRPCTSLFLCLAAAVALPALPAHAVPGPTCAGPDDRRFPITSRIHGGPDTYRAGGGYGVFLIDLTNTASRTCAAIHPVVVLVDTKGALGADQAHMEFYDGSEAHPVSLETTDQQELVGPFDAGLPGFTVGPGETVTVTVRLAITSDAVADEVTATAAVVQRHDDDGDWVGQSDDYAFRIEADPEDTGTGPHHRRPHGGPHAPGDRVPGAGELARTGQDIPPGALTVAATLLAAGATLTLTRGRRRP